ncbi:MAG: hypothetical protein JSU86_05970 [Phycisphaerales bacterium]|nr:MAG: hypothetical protein JSU86_05970 [Phycisphaerales bacterium]
MVKKPVLQALVLADHIYVDERTKKNIIAGTFSRLWTNKFPAMFGRTTGAYICLTEVQGKVPISLRYTDLKTNEVLLSTEAFTLQSGNPLATHELIVEVPPFPMPHAGVYVFEVYAGAEAIGSLRLTVGKVEQGKQ